MQICLREKELQYQIREQSLHHKIDKIQSSKSVEASIELHVPQSLRHSEGSGALYQDQKEINSETRHLEAN